MHFGRAKSNLTFQYWEIHSQVFNHSQKPTRVDPQDHWDHGGACLQHIPSKHVPQSPYIPAHWASTHRPPTSPDSAREGHQAGGRPAHQAPSLPGHPLGNAKGKENKRDEEVACAGPRRKKCKTFCGAGQPHTLRVFKCQRTTCVCLPVLLSPMESLTVSYPPPGSTSLSHVL